jgi:hypothetical protein
MSNGEYSIGFGECTGTVLPAHAHLAALVAGPSGAILGPEQP